MRRQRTILGFLVMVLALLAVGPALGADYYVSALTGDDATGDGSAGNPYKSITAAVTGLSFTFGDILYVGPGVYDAANGEIYPVLIPYGVTLLGDDPRWVVIDGGGPGTTSWAVVQLAESATLQKVTVTGSTDGWWDGGVYLGWGTAGAHDALVEDCIITGNERGLWGFELDTVLVRNCMFVNNRNDGVSLFTSENVVVINNSFYNNLKGVILADCAGDVWNNVISTSGQSGIEVNNTFVFADYNCVWNCNPNYNGISPGGSDINVDPILPFGANDDLHLAAFSPCIDNADFGHWAAPDRDIFDKDRNTGNGMDRGASEAVYRELFVMGLPLQGQEVDLDITGMPADWWLLMASGSTGNYTTPFGQLLIGVPFFVLGSGTMGGQGAVSLAGTVPAGLTGITIYFQAIVGDHLSNRYDLLIY